MDGAGEVVSSPRREGISDEDDDSMGISDGASVGNGIGAASLGTRVGAGVGNRVGGMSSRGGATVGSGTVGSGVVGILVGRGEILAPSLGAVVITLP